MTDTGIEIGKLIYWNRDNAKSSRLHVRADRQKLRRLTSLIGLFLVGGVCGALLFNKLGVSAAPFLPRP